MTNLKKINEVRRTIMRKLTRKIGGPKSTVKLSTEDLKAVKKILISRPNHRLGNMLLISPLLQEVAAVFPESKIDLFVKGDIASTVFKNYENVNTIIRLPKKHFRQLHRYVGGWLSIRRKKYDLVINVDQHSSSGRLSTQLANARIKVFGDADETIHSKYEDYRHFAKHPVYNLREYLARLGFESGNRPIASIDLKLSAAELEQGRTRLGELVPNEKKTIAIYTFATGAKMYSEAWWKAFYERLLKEYPDFNILEVLPIENISLLSFKVPHFYSRDIREIAALIANTVVFIGADSGMMHLASASLTPTVGLFSVTDPVRYQPFGNGSVAINTNLTDIDGMIRILNNILLNDGNQ